MKSAHSKLHFIDDQEYIEFIKRETKTHLVRYYMKMCEHHGLVYGDWIVLPCIVFTRSGHDPKGIYLRCDQWEPTAFEKEEMKRTASAVNMIQE